MKKLLLALTSIFFITSGATANENTIYIDLEQVPEQVIKNIKLSSEKSIKAELDLTNLVVFVREWKDNNSRRDELINLYSSVVPKVFKLYPKYQEFQLSTFVSYKDRISAKNETKYISKLIITKNDFNKINWQKVKKLKDPSMKKYIKVMDFINL